ncbi:MAG: 2-hydroxy-3-oxopropionate reductase [Gammaproteobacteria bacterium]|nr:2-hydroxy-3-oxopropionate reductase [Gammaproteobacteria bacterium]
MKAGVIGLGAMGAHMAVNLDRAGLLAAIWNRTAQTAATLPVGADVLRAGSPREVAAVADVIITCVSRDADVLEMVDAMTPAIRPDAIVCDTSTVSAATAREAARRLAARAAHFLDCPVSGGVEGARDATLAMMVGGDEAALELARPLLSKVAAKIVHMGPSGSGQATKAVNQIMVAGINHAVTEALAFGAAMGLDMEKVIAVVGSGAAANWFLDKRGRTMVAGTYAPGFKLALHHKDLTIVRDMARERLNGPLTVVDATLADYERLMSEGRGEEDISALYRLKRSQYG